MRGFEGFFSPVVPPRPVASTARRPWGEREEKGSREEDPDRRPPSASAAAATAAPAAAPPPSRHVSMHPELGPPSASSFGSIPSPVRENNNNPENNRELRRRLTVGAATAQPPAPGRPQEQGRARRDRDQRGRRWPGRLRLWRICVFLAVLALLGVVAVTRMILSFKRGQTPRMEARRDNNDEQPAAVSIPGAGSSTSAAAIPEDPQGQSTSQPIAERNDPPATLDTMPSSPAVPKTPLLVQASEGKEESIDTEDVPKEEEVCWIFMHMEKSGGGAVRQIASKHWRKEELVFDTVQWRRGDTYAEDMMTSNWNLLHGGCVEALRSDNARPCRWITIFRHPIARLLSAYDHCREAPKDPLCPPTKSKDLASFAERWGNFAMRQFALAEMSASAVKEWAARGRVPKGTSVWYLVKEYLTRGGVPEDEVLGGLLPSVQDLLSTQYAAVGIATELDATMRLFDKALSMKGLDWLSSLSKFPMQDEEEDLEYDMVESATFREALANSRIASAIRLDIALYDHAVRVFKKQVAQYAIE